MRDAPRRLVACALAALLAACGVAADDPVVRGAEASTTTEASEPSRPPTTSATSPTNTAAAAVTTTTTTTAVPAAEVGDHCPVAPPRATPAPNRPVYDLDVSADPVTGSVSGTMEVSFTPDLPTDRVVFRLWANGPRPSGAGTSLSVSGVVVRSPGLSARVAQPDPTTLVLHLDEEISSGTTVLLALDFDAQVAGPVHDRISRQAESLRLGSFFPLLAWEPGVGWTADPPTSGFAEATTSPTADWLITIDVPDGFAAIASGVEEVPGVWVAESVRDVAVAVGRFTRVTGTAHAPDAVDVVVAAHDGVDDPDRYLSRVIAALETFAQWYGPYPWPTYQLSLTPHLGGGIEYPMHVMQGPGTQGRTTPHEVAHMWFYGLVGNNQGRDPWLDEGLATWAEVRFDGAMASLHTRSIPEAGAGRAGEPMTYWEHHPDAYYRSVYVQPAAALSRLGDAELVDCSLAFYVAENAYTVATPDDLYRSLDATFAAWQPVLAEVGLGR